MAHIDTKRPLSTAWLANRDHIRAKIYWQLTTVPA
jgi:hypothetical protein